MFASLTKHLFRQTLVLLVVSLGLGMEAEAADPQPVSIQFKPQVGSQPFTCDQSYQLGVQSTETTVGDFRLYVSEMSLLTTTGARVPITLEQDGQWQYQSVALLDFEDKSGSCVNGTVETRDQVVGSVPAGDYEGLQFTLGIPFDLNHEDATLAASPLNLTAMWWNWRGGYKFIRIDLEPSMTMSRDNATHGSEHHHHASDHHASDQGSSQGGYLFHLGSTGCEVEGDSQRPSRCLNRNAPTIQLADFDPEQDTVVVDMAALLADSDLSRNQPETPLGCMSDPNDGDCVEIFTQLGLEDQPQAFFRIQ